MYTISTEYTNPFENELVPVINTDSLRAVVSAAPADVPAGGFFGGGAMTAPSFSLGSAALAAVPWEIVRGLVGNIIWKWYDSHKTDTVVRLSVKVIFFPIRITVKVKDCELLFRALFGENTAAGDVN